MGGKGGVAIGVKLCAGESAYDEGSMGVWTISARGYRNDKGRAEVASCHFHRQSSFNASKPLSFKSSHLGITHVHCHWEV